MLHAGNVNNTMWLHISQFHTSPVRQKNSNAKRKDMMEHNFRIENALT